MPPYPWGTPLSLAGGGSGRPRARYFGATSRGPESRQEVFPQAAQEAPVRPLRDHYGQTQKLWSGQAGDPAQRRASAAPLSEQPCRELAPTDPPAGAAPAGIQV